MVTDDEIDFLRAMQGVRQLDKTATPPSTVKRQGNRALRAEIRQRALHPANASSKAEHPAAPAQFNGQSNDEADTALFYLRHGVQKKVLRDLKKGLRYPAQGTLDLHGLTQMQAQLEIDRALVDFNYAGLACLLIIHGKGLGSSKGPVLKKFTSAYLKTLPQVRAYCSALLRDGGTGALYVLLRGS